MTDLATHAAIQKAIDEASAAGGSIVHLPATTIELDETLEMRDGVTLEGEGGGIFGPSPIVGTKLVPSRDLETLIQWGDLSEPVLNAGLRDLNIDCRQGLYEIGKAIHVWGRKSRLERLDVANGRGDGVVYERDPGKGWIHWFVGNHVRRFDGYGLLFNTTDSFVEYNYFTSRVRQQSPGGNSFVGNHFTGAQQEPGGPSVEFVTEPGSATFVGQFVANYVDDGSAPDSVGVLFRSHDGTTPYNLRMSILGNSFRNNRVDLQIEGAIHPTIGPNAHQGSPNSEHGIRLLGCKGGQIEGATWNREGYTEFISGVQPDLSVRNCVASGSLRSESRGMATIPTGERQVTVKHDLLWQPVSVVATPVMSARAAWVSNLNEETFDVVIGRAAQKGGVQVSWSAYCTP